MSGGLARVVLAVPLAAAAHPALAHHGAAAVSAVGVEGPGAALDITSPLPLGQGTVLQASGGTILYGQLGARTTFGSLSLGVGVKRP